MIYLLYSEDNDSPGKSVTDMTLSLHSKFQIDFNLAKSE